MTDAVRTFLADRLDIEHQVAAKALEDPSFAAELRQDPRGALETLLGCELPDTLTVRIVEQGSTEILAAVPAPEEDALSEDELASAAGGLTRGLTGAPSGGGMVQDMMNQNRQMLTLQQSIQMESRRYRLLSNALSAAHQSASNSIRNMK